jgi:hypothetical protein
MPVTQDRDRDPRILTQGDLNLKAAQKAAAQSLRSPQWHCQSGGHWQLLVVNHQARSVVCTVGN